MSKVVTTTVLPDVAGGSVTLGGTGDSVVVTGNDLRTNVLQDAGGNAVFTSDGSGVLSGMNSDFPGALNLISTTTVSSAVTNIAFTTGIDSTYDVYIFKFVDIGCSATWAQFSFNGSTDGGSNYNATKTTTLWDADNTESGTNTIQYETADDHANATGYAILGHALGGSDADACAAGEIYLFSPSNTTYVKHFYSTEVEMYSNSARIIFNFGGGYFNTTSAINAIDFKMTTGNIDAGVIKMYGISKS
tara:strand:+ start:552 stop:1292 length:741 start_codon:yes stop_codon:yes gene_type:complete